MKMKLSIKYNTIIVKKLNVIIHYFLCSNFSIICEKVNIKRMNILLKLHIDYDMRCKLSTLKTFKIVILFFLNFKMFSTVVCIQIFFKTKN